MDRLWRFQTITGLAALIASSCASVSRPAEKPRTPAKSAQAGDGDVVGPSDLSLCTRPKPDLGRTPSADVRELARRLHGTWELNTRTIQGLTIPTHSYFFFDLDLEHATSIGASGAAMVLDAGNLGVLDVRSLTHECPKDACLGAFWTVSIDTPDDGRQARLTMDGDYLGSYGEFSEGMKATEAMTFLLRNGVYLSGGLTTPNGGMGEDVWDRVSLEKNLLIYLSCKNAYVERYVKLSSERPLVDGLALRDAWIKKKQTGELLDPAYGRRPK